MQISHAAVDPHGSTTATPSHLGPATAPATACADLDTPAAHRSCSWPSSTLFLFCSSHAWSLRPTHSFFSPQRQTPCFFRISIPHTPRLPQTRLGIHFRISGIVVVVPDTTAGSPRIDGFANTHTAPGQRILASLLRFLLLLFLLVVSFDGLGCWCWCKSECESAACAGLGCG